MPYTTLRDHVKGISQKIGAGSPTVLTKAEEQEIVATCQVSTIIITKLILFFLLQVFLTVTLWCKAFTFNHSYLTLTGFTGTRIRTNQTVCW